MSASENPTRSAATCDQAALHALNMAVGAVEASWRGVYEGGSLIAGRPLGTLTHYLVPADKLAALIQAALKVVE